MQKKFEGVIEYEKVFKLDELFPFKSGGITIPDAFVTGFTAEEIKKRIQTFLDPQYSISDLKELFEIKENEDWNIEKARSSNSFNEYNIQKITFHPFDNRYVYNDRRLIDFGPEDTMNQMIKGNVSLIAVPESKNTPRQSFWISKFIVPRNVISSSDTSVFPLYLYPESDLSKRTPGRIPNLDSDIIHQITTRLGLSFTPEKEMPSEGEVCFLNSEEVRPEFRFTFAPIDLLDYIYAVLHSTAYREKYKEVLRIDFPVPYPNAATFWKLVKLGGELRQMHLLECTAVNHFKTQYPVEGNNVISRVKYANGKVYLNENQYFEHVPLPVWNFYIGGYQPAAKWLIDREGLALGFDDIRHYQKIIVALSETDRIQKKINEV